MTSMPPSSQARAASASNAVVSAELALVLQLQQLPDSQSGHVVSLCPLSASLLPYLLYTPYSCSVSHIAMMFSGGTLP